MFLDDVEILMDGVRGAPIPPFAVLLLRRDDLDELAHLAPQEAPAAPQVLDQCVCLVLRQHQHLPDSGIDAVRQREIDDSVFAAEWRGGFRAVSGQVGQSLAPPAGHDDRHRPTRELADKSAGFPSFHCLGELLRRHSIIYF